MEGTYVVFGGGPLKQDPPPAPHLPLTCVFFVLGVQLDWQLLLSLKVDGIVISSAFMQNADTVNRMIRINRVQTVP